MLNYVLSLSIDTRRNCCMMLFNDKGTMQSYSCDSNVNFDSFIKDKILPVIEITNVDIVINESGYGRTLKDSLLKNGVNITYSIRSPYGMNQYMTLCYKDAISDLKNIEDSNDKKILEKELLNLEIQMRTENKRFMFVKKDNNIDNLRAECYLQGFAYIRYIKERRDISINDLNYIRNMYDHDMQVYELLSSKEEYLKRQMNQRREKHSKEITFKMNEELLYTQKELIKTINKLHGNSKKWLNIEKERLKNEYDDGEYSRLVENNK